MQIPVLSGREFTAAIRPTRPAVAVVNERYAQRHFPDRNPVGQHLTANVRGQHRRSRRSSASCGTRNTRSLRAAPPATVYVAYAQLAGNLGRPRSRSAPPARSARSPRRCEQRCRRGFRSAPVDVRPLSAQVGATIVQERMMATLAGGFGLLALALASRRSLRAARVRRRPAHEGDRHPHGARRAAQARGRAGAERRARGW